MNPICEKDVFLRFKQVQMSGVVNMFDRRAVCGLADITEDEYTYVTKNYSELDTKYGGESI